MCIIKARFQILKLQRILGPYTIVFGYLDPRGTLCIEGDTSALVLVGGALLDLPGSE